MYRVHKDFSPYKPVEREQLDQVIDSKVLRLDGLDAPIIIEKIELLFNYGAYMVRTISKDGMVGISITNDRIQYVYPILEKLIAPYFIGKDARKLEELLDQVYVYKSNYKMAGIPYYSAFAALELSILDLLAKAKHTGIIGLFGERKKELGEPVCGQRQPPDHSPGGAGDYPGAGGEKRGESHQVQNRRPHEPQ